MTSEKSTLSAGRWPVLGNAQLGVNRHPTNAGHERQR